MYLMQLKGLNKFREKVPWFSGKRVFLIPVFFLFIIAATLLIVIAFDSLPGWLLSCGCNNTALSFSPLIGELLIVVVGFLLVYQMWYRRDYLKSKYGPNSYQHIFWTGLIGIILVLSFSLSLLIPFRYFSPTFWTQSQFQIMAQPLESFIPALGPTIFWIRIVLAIFLLIIGIGTAIRSLQTFGLDYMALVYLYFPEEGQLQEHAIYSVMRHPAYSGALTIGLGGMFFIFTPFSIIFFLIYLAGFYIHVYLVEERELISRFGESFLEYRKKVPAFMVRPSKIQVLLIFLFRGPEAQSKSL